MKTLAKSFPLGFRLDRGGLRMLARTRRWRLGGYVLEEPMDRDTVWILGADEIGQLDALPRAMTDRDVVGLRMAGVQTVAELLVVVESTVALGLLVELQS